MFDLSLTLTFVDFFSLFRVTLKTYIEYPRAELPQILWNIVKSQLETDPYESSVLYNPVPDNVNERNYQFNVTRYL